jgi:hypothetical protein
MERQNDFSSVHDRESHEKAQAAAGEMKDEAIHRGRERAESVKHQAAKQAENVAAAAERISEDLRGELPRVADYTNEIADSIRDFADGLRNRSIDDLLRDTQDLARRNPTLFFLGSAAVGVALARFFKASAEPEHRTGFSQKSNDWGDGPVEPEKTEIHAPGTATRPFGGTGPS